MNRVVITGMGIYSTIGYNIDEVRQSLYTGKSGIVFDPIRKDLGFRSSLTGYIERPILKGILSRRMRVGLAEQGEYAYIATTEAINNAGIDEEFLNKNEVGIIYGNDSSSTAVIDAADLIRDKKDTMLVGSASIFQSMNSTVSMNLSVILKLKGINFTISGACASGSHAIGMGYLMIKQGLQDIIICGGAQEVNALSMGSFDGINAFSIREDSPTKASRPFDRDRDGLVPSGGGATVILESYESAKKKEELKFLLRLLVTDFLQMVNIYLLQMLKVLLGLWKGLLKMQGLILKKLIILMHMQLQRQLEIKMKQKLFLKFSTKE